MSFDGHTGDTLSRTKHEVTDHQATGRTSDVAQLSIEAGDRVDRMFLLTGQVVTIGRTPSNSLPLQHESVSRQHAELRMTPEGAMLTDVGSRNGTFVGREQLVAHQPVRLTPGSTIRIGPFVLRYEVVLSGGTEQPTTQLEERSSAAATPDLAPVPSAPSPFVPAQLPRETLSMPLPEALASNYLDYLPVIFQEPDFLGRFLMIFQSIWEPLEQRQDHLAMYFDPRTSPASFLDWLAAWVGIQVGPRFAEGRLRALLSEAVELYRWRGTRYGLTRMIEVCTGVTPVIAESQANPAVLHVRISALKDGDVDRDTIERLIVANKPAHTAYVLEMTGPD